MTSKFAASSCYQKKNGRRCCSSTHGITSFFLGALVMGLLLQCGRRSGGLISTGVTGFVQFVPTTCIHQNHVGVATRETLFMPLKYKNSNVNEEEDLIINKNVEDYIRETDNTMDVVIQNGAETATTTASSSTPPTPTMLKEIHQTLALSLLMYQLVELRHNVAANKVSLPSNVDISLPRPAGQLLRAGKVAFVKNKVSSTAGRATANRMNHNQDSHQEYDDEKQQPQQKQHQQLTDVNHDEHLDTMSTAMDEMDGFQLEILKRTQVLTLNDDDHAVREARVYAISLDHVMKRVIVSFRGSSSIYDWIHDAQFHLVKILDPFNLACFEDGGASLTGSSVMKNSAEKHVGLHSGFYKALHCDATYHNNEWHKSNKKKNHISKISKDKLQVPLDYNEMIQTIKKLNVLSKGYKLYVTGHSLGGALATIFGYFAACDNDLIVNGPVTIYSYSSPRVGDYHFHQSFKRLEQAGRLVHARIRNHLDKVAQLPTPLLMGTMFTYKHVGLMINLKGDQSTGLQPVLDYPKDRSWTQDAPTLWENIFTLNGTLKYHSPEEIFRRIKSWKHFFASLKLEDQYHDIIVKK